MFSWFQDESTPDTPTLVTVSESDLDGSILGPNTTPVDMETGSPAR